MVIAELTLTLHPRTHGHHASVSLGPYPIPHQRAFTVETNSDDVTQTTVTGVLDSPLNLAGTAGQHSVTIHLDKLGSNSTISIGDQPLTDFYLKLHQQYDQILWLEFSGLLGDQQLDYGGPFTLDPVTGEASDTGSSTQQSLD